MATRVNLLSIIFLIVSLTSSSFIQYKLAEDHRYRPTLVTFLHRQPSGSQLATIRYYRIVFHCEVLPGSLYLRFSSAPPLRTVVQNRRDPSTVFAFRSVGAFSRVQIQHQLTKLWLCLNRRGRIVTKTNISMNDLSCTFRQDSDGVYLKLVSELDPSRVMSFDLHYLLSMNSHLSRRYAHLASSKKRCQRFIFDGNIDRTNERL